jgi:hypothetical protein
MKNSFKLLLFLINILTLSVNIFAQTVTVKTDEKAEAIIKRAVEKLGGERYLQVKTQVSTGNFTPFRDGMSEIPSGFIDVISFPDKERTEFKQLGNKIVQTNVKETGWLFDGGPKTIREQNQKEIESFRQGQRTSLDSLLRGGWRTKGATQESENEMML